MASASPGLKGITDTEASELVDWKNPLVYLI